MILFNSHEPTPETTQLIMSKAFQYGYGVFETMRTYNGRVFKLEAHLIRLFESAKSIGLSLHHNQLEIEEQVNKALELSAKTPQRVKVIASSEFTVITTTDLLTDESLYRGVSCVTVDVERPFPDAKSLHYLDSYLAHQFALNNGAYEALLVNRKGHITEGAYSNVFGVKNSKLTTPARGMLKGITRSIVLNLAREQEVDVTKRALLQKELPDMEELFLTQTTMGIVPITKVNDIQIGNEKVGPITSRLMEAYGKLTREHEQ